MTPLCVKNDNLDKTSLYVVYLHVYDYLRENHTRISTKLLVWNRGGGTCLCDGGVGEEKDEAKENWRRKDVKMLDTITQTQSHKITCAYV